MMEYKHNKSKKGLAKRWISGLLAVIMLITAFPLQAIAAKLDYDDIGGQKSTYINNVDPVTPVKTDNAEKYIKDPDMPEIYTLRTDYMVKKNGDWKINYQPYVASVGANATPEERANVDKTINLPDLTGYKKPQESYKITYDIIKNNAKNPEKDGFNFSGNQEFLYDAKENDIKIKHVFQKLEDFNKYEERPEIGKTKQTGFTGSNLEVSPITDSRVIGFKPEARALNILVPENAENFEVEFRYNRKAFEVNFDTDGGSSIATRLVYFEQVIPKVEEPKKAGSTFVGWKPSVDLKDSDGKEFKANTLMKDSASEPIKDLNANIIMPSENVTFTAVWEENEKTEYVIQFWTEKTDYDDENKSLPLRDRYDFIGARRVDNAQTNSTPDLTNLDIHGITLPDLNDGRLEKAQDDKEEFERYYFLNEDLTKKQNASKEDPTVQKSVLSTGETVYNVYYDRRVYTLYFTAANDEGWDPNSSYWPTLTRNGQVIGTKGSPYKVEARFNQSLDKIWPRDEEISGLPPASSSPDGDRGPIGWTINVKEPGELIFRDTPPYRLSAEDFIDSEDVETFGNGHGEQIPLGENQTKARGKYEISLAATSWDESVVHHIDIIKDDFDGNEQIDYDLSYWKSDTNATYAFILPHLQGFTLKQDTREAEWVLEKPTSSQYKTINDLNNARNEKTPFRSDADKIEYIDKFPWGTKYFDGKNRYNFANYSRNKYKLKLNNDPKTVKNDGEYGAGNILEVPYEKPLNDLNLDTTHVPERPDWVADDWSFLGWALDPAGENLVKDGNETKLHYDQVLYAKWGEPDTFWTVTVDPAEGKIKDLNPEDMVKKKVTVDTEEGKKEYPIKEENQGANQIFTVKHKQQLKELPNPTRKGYDFLGWEWVRYKKDANGDYTNEQDTSYRDTYKVPERYPFGNDVVSNVYLKAIWVENNRVDVEVYHHFLDKDGNEIKDAYNPKIQTLKDIRANSWVSANAIYQNEDWILMPHEELLNVGDEELKNQYIEYNERVKFDNKDLQILRVEPEKILKGDEMVPNPDVKNNEFHFYYRRFKTRDYKVNYLDKKAKDKIDEIIAGTDTIDAKKEAIAKIVKDNSIIAQEEVVSRNRHYDARNYRHIPGWKLVSDPQQQLFYDVDEATGEFKGINGTGLDEIFFYYEDVRVIDVPGNQDPPEGYVRVTFKADKGGSFTDKDENSKTEIYYDVIKGLKSDLLVVPQELKEGAVKEEGKYYITPDNGKTFTKWDEKPLLNDNTIIEHKYTFTAYFDWSGLSANGIVTTEAFIDPNGTWTNDFAPKIDDLKKQLEWKEKDVVKPLPAGTDIKFYDEDGNEIKTDEDVFKLVNEKKAADKDELVRTVNIKAKVTFPDKKDPQELDIPVKVYKNVYEALNKAGDKPLFLKEAEGKEAKDGGLKDITGNYVKVIVQPTEKNTNKDAKVYYVNPKAWVEIPEVEWSDADKDKYDFLKWTADKVGQNEDGKENGIFDFGKRHKFTDEETLIKPLFSNDVVEQKDGEDKPTVPDNFVKVVVTTKENDVEKATEETKFERTFWVNPTKEVTIPVTNPTGDVVKDDKGNVVTDAAGNEIKWTFKEWSSPLTATFTGKETTITAKYEKTIPEPTVDADTVETYVGREPELGDYKKVLKASLGGEGIDFDEKVKEITVVDKPDVSKPGMSEAKVKVEFNNGQVKEVTVPVKVYNNIYPGDTNGDKTSETPDYYVKVTVNPKAYDEDDQKIKVYYVNPLAKVKIPEISIKESDKEKYGFKKWTTDNKEINALDPKEVYDFTKEYQFKVDTEIYAFYEKNGEPEIKIDFETKEIVKNIGDEVSIQEYKDALIVPKDPSGKPLVDVKAINVVEDADTSKEGYSPAKIQVVYDDGKTEEVVVIVKVLPDYVEQKDGEDKPAVPDNFVKVIVDKTENAQLQLGEQQTQVFWVNPEKVVTIPVGDPTGKVETKPDGTVDYTWMFTGWDNNLTQQFKAEETKITAQYEKDFGGLTPIKPIPEARGGFIYTDLGKQVTNEDYKSQIILPDGYSFETGTTFEIVPGTEPNIYKTGLYSVKVWVNYPDGSGHEVTILVYVGEAKVVPQPLPQPGGTGFNVVYIEKKVEVPAKMDPLHKEVRYMQGFNGYFRPNDGLTRAEAAQILANALVEDGYNYNPDYKISYPDIGNEWYTRAIKITTEANVFAGYDDGYFRPEKKITRAEWVATLRRFQNIAEADGNHMNLCANHWAKGEIEGAYNEGWLKIYTDGLAKFNADEFIPRQEVAAVSNRAFNRVFDKTYIDRNDKALINQYKDVKPSMWAYEDILCASNTFVHDENLYRAHDVKNDKITFNVNLDGLEIIQDKFQRILR